MSGHTLPFVDSETAPCRYWSCPTLRPLHFDKVDTFPLPRPLVVSPSGHRRTVFADVNKWETRPTVGIAYSLRWQVELVFRGWKSGLHVATITTTKHSTLCYLYGRMLLILLTSALSSPLRVVVWQQRRELSLFKLARHFQAHADHWLQCLFHSPPQLLSFLSRLCMTAERLVRKAVRKRRTSAQRLRESLETQMDFFEPALALAA
jgi:hypothetical protein